jgi:outer membrane protein OmpA-like peptidoglycan-associated protein
LRPVPVVLGGAIAFAALCWWCVAHHADLALAAPPAAPPPMASAAITPPPAPVTTPPATPAERIPAAGVRVAAAIDAQLRGRTIEFETASAVITPRGRAVLDSLVTLLASAPTQRFEVAGHTDARGNPDANQRLSEQRAVAVRRYLAARGIEAARLDPRGYGATRPLTTDTTADAMQRNRRIEFTPLPER